MARPFEEKQIGRQEKELKEYQKVEKEKEKEVEKEQKDQKDNPDAKNHKDAKDSPDTKHKHEKEKQEKHERPEKEPKLEIKEHLYEKIHLETIEPFAASTQAPISHKLADKIPSEGKLHKDFKIEIKEHKEFKLEKLEFKEHKNEYKEYKDEKFEFEGGRGYVGPGTPIEQRLAALEAAVTQLLHFIPENLRPNLAQGALKQEPDAEKAAKPAEPKTEPHKGKS